VKNLHDLISYQLARLVNINDRLAQAHLSEEFGITLGEWRTFANMQIMAPVSLAALAREMLADKGQISRMVRGLIRRRWVDSRKTPGNRRSVTLTLTALGQAKHREIFAFVIERNRALQSVLLPRERAQLSGILKNLTAYDEILLAELAGGSARRAESIAKRRTRGLKSR
jgi:DNA-binding MarR family transcriptional regulator